MYPPPTVSGAVPQGRGTLASDGTSDTPQLLRRAWTLQHTAPVPRHKVRTSNHQFRKVPSIGQEWHAECERVPQVNRLSRPKEGFKHTGKATRLTLINNQHLHYQMSTVPLSPGRLPKYFKQVIAVQNVLESQKQIT